MEIYTSLKWFTLLIYRVFQAIVLSKLSSENKWGVCFICFLNKKRKQTHLGPLKKEVKLFLGNRSWHLRKIHSVLGRWKGRALLLCCSFPEETPKPGGQNFNFQKLNKTCGGAYPGQTSNLVGGDERETLQSPTSASVGCKIWSSAGSKPVNEIRKWL